MMEYLAARRLLPLPELHGLKAHNGLGYWNVRSDGSRECAGHFPALIAEVRDVRGGLVSAHATYLDHSRKLDVEQPRKFLSGLSQQPGCAVRLMPIGPTGVLGVGEGIETCLAAALIHGISTWAALTAPLLAKFEPPLGVRQLVVFADRDSAGERAAVNLVQRLGGQVPIEVHTPRPPSKDWADALDNEHH